MQTTNQTELRIGWGITDITPIERTNLGGQHYVRCCEGVKSPLKATALAMESADQQVVMVSCDLSMIYEQFLEDVRSGVAACIDDLDPKYIVINASHTHSAPRAGSLGMRYKKDAVDPEATGDVVSELQQIGAKTYRQWAATRVVQAIKDAWESRTRGAIGFGLSHAVVSHNRMSAYADGKSLMYGNTDDPTFSHMEGYEDHHLQVITTYDAQQSLTGMVINVASPS